VRQCTLLIYFPVTLNEAAMVSHKKTEQVNFVVRHFFTSINSIYLVTTSQNLATMHSTLQAFLEVLVFVDSCLHRPIL